MKKSLIALSAVLGMAMSAQASLTGSLKNASNDSLDAAQSIADGIMKGSVKISNMSVKGVGLAADGSLFIVQKAESAAQKGSDLAVSAGKSAWNGSVMVFTSTKDMVSATVDSTKKAILVTIDQSGRIATTVSTKTIAVAKWSANETQFVGQAALDVSGNIIAVTYDSSKKALVSTGRVIGKAMTLTGESLQFVSAKTSEVTQSTVNTSGKFLTYSSEKSENLMILTADTVKNLFENTKVRN